jgi:hypothetical protein
MKKTQKLLATIVSLIILALFVGTAQAQVWEGAYTITDSYDMVGLNKPFIRGFDPAKANNWSMKIKISGSTESIWNIFLKNYTKEERNPKGVRQVFAIISMIEFELRTKCLIYNDDSKDPDIYTYNPALRRIKRHSKTEFENNKYENTALTLKEIMDIAVKLIDRDQVKVNDNTVTVMERNIRL